MQPTAKDYAEEAKWRKALEPIIREQIAREIAISKETFLRNATKERVLLKTVSEIEKLDFGVNTAKAIFDGAAAIARGRDDRLNLRDV